MTFSLVEMRATTGGSLYGLGPLPLGTISSVAWALGVAKRALHEIAGIAKSGRARLGALPLAEQPTFQRDLGTHMMGVQSARLLAKQSYESAVEQGASDETCRPARTGSGRPRPRQATGRRSRRKP